MAEEKKPTERKRKKTAVPEKPASGPGAFPSATEIRSARKAQLVAWAEASGLDAEGKVDELRKRLLGLLAEREAQAKRAEEAKPAPPEEPVEEAAPAKRPRRAAKERKPEPVKAKKEKPEEKPVVHEARAKPALDDRMRRLLAVRAAKSAARPRFRRQEWFRYRKFGDEWRKPQGGQSKLRRHFGYRWNLPSVGYRGPKAVRGLHPSGFQEVLVHNERQLEGLDEKKQAVRIARGVGARKREAIEKACEDRGLRVLNRMVTE